MLSWLKAQWLNLKNKFSRIDSDNDDRIDKAESVDDGTYSKTAQQISEHIDSTSDPHNTIPSQTGNAGKYFTTDGITTSWGAGPGGSTSGSVVLSFTNADLVSGIYTGVHNLNANNLDVIVYNDSEKEVIPDDVNDNTGSPNTTKIDLSSFGTITGTWHVRFTGGSVDAAQSEIITLGESVSIGDVLYKKSSDGKWYKGIATNTSSVTHNCTVVANESGIANDSIQSFAISKIVTANATFNSTDINKEVFLDNSTAGSYDLFSNITYSTGDHVVKIGTIISTSEMLFNPEYRYQV